MSFQWDTRDHRNLYDRADAIATKVTWIVIALAASVFAGYIVRAALNFDRWKWMVQ